MGDVASEFEGFRDDPASAFYCADGLSAEETWAAGVNQMKAVLLRLPAAVADDDFEISTAVLAGWHDEIFGPLFPSDSGRLRWRKDGAWEEVYFGGNVGTFKSRRHKQYRGVHPQKLSKRVADVCAEFNAERAGLIAMPTGTVSLNDASYAIARLYAKLLRAHPFVDGNLRVAYVALHAALLSLDLPRVTFKDLDEHDDLIGVAFQGNDQPYRPLGDYIAQYIRDGFSG